MKVLYAIQGTGNGHVARAREIIPVLQKMCDLDLLISGIQSDVQLSQEVKYRYKGLSFIFGRHGGVDVWGTYAKNKMHRLLKEYEHFPAQDYNLIINDFEPITAWSARKKGVKCVSLSHQCAVLAEESPKPKHKDPLGYFILKNYAPADRQYGFHFERYAPNIYTPVIRSEIRKLSPSNQKHYTVYLPAYDDETLLKHLKHFKGVSWQVFSKYNKQALVEANVHLRPIDNQGFIESLAHCEGVLCGAGFEAPAEALFLGKKVLAIPMKGQYEQHCNAAALKLLGVPTIYSLSSKYYDNIGEWLNNKQRVDVDYPDEVGAILERVLSC